MFNNFKINYIDVLMPSFDNQIHNTEFLRKINTFHKDVLKINNNKTLSERK